MLGVRRILFLRSWLREAREFCSSDFNVFLVSTKKDLTVSVCIHVLYSLYFYTPCSVLCINHYTLCGQMQCSVHQSLHSMWSDAVFCASIITLYVVRCSVLCINHYTLCDQMQCSVHQSLHSMWSDAVFCASIITLYVVRCSVLCIIILYVVRCSVLCINHYTLCGQMQCSVHQSLHSM